MMRMHSCYGVNNVTGVVGGSYLLAVTSDNCDRLLELHLSFAAVDIACMWFGNGSEDSLFLSSGSSIMHMHPSSPTEPGTERRHCKCCPSSFHA